MSGQDQAMIGLGSFKKGEGGQNFGIFHVFLNFSNRGCNVPTTGEDMTRSKSLRIGRISQDHPPRVPKHPRSFDLFHRWQWQRALLQFLFFYDDGYLVGLPAYSHHDRFPPWWVFVCVDNGGNLSGDKIPPLMMIMIRHLTHLNLS